MDNAGGWQWLETEVLHCSNNLLTRTQTFPPGHPHLRIGAGTVLMAVWFVA